ncbi:hypothetical protein MY1884_002830 [Beauveria asiatica]
MFSSCHVERSMPCPHQPSAGKNMRNKKRAHVPRRAPSNLVSHSPSMPSLTRHQCHRRPAAPVLPRNYIQHSSHSQHHHASPAGVPPPITNLPARPSPTRHGITKRPEYSCSQLTRHPLLNFATATGHQEGWSLVGPSSPAAIGHRFHLFLVHGLAFLQATAPVLANCTIKSHN